MIVYDKEFLKLRKKSKNIEGDLETTQSSWRLGDRLQYAESISENKVTAEKAVSRDYTIGNFINELAYTWRPDENRGVVKKLLKGRGDKIITHKLAKGNRFFGMHEFDHAYDKGTAQETKKDYTKVNVLFGGFRHLTDKVVIDGEVLKDKLDIKALWGKGKKNRNLIDKEEVTDTSWNFGKKLNYVNKTTRDTISDKKVVFQKYAIGDFINELAYIWRPDKDRGVLETLLRGRGDKVVMHKLAKGNRFFGMHEFDYVYDKGPSHEAKKDYTKVNVLFGGYRQESNNVVEDDNLLKDRTNMSVLWGADSFQRHYEVSKTGVVTDSERDKSNILFGLKRVENINVFINDQIRKERHHTQALWGLREEDLHIKRHGSKIVQTDKVMRPSYSGNSEVVKIDGVVRSTTRRENSFFGLDNTYSLKNNNLGVKTEEFHHKVNNVLYSAFRNEKLVDYDAAKKKNYIANDVTYGYGAYRAYSSDDVQNHKKKTMSSYGFGTVQSSVEFALENSGRRTKTLKRNILGVNYERKTDLDTNRVLSPKFSFSFKSLLPEKTAIAAMASNSNAPNFFEPDPKKVEHTTAYPDLTLPSDNPEYDAYVQRRNSIGLIENSQDAIASQRELLDFAHSKGEKVRYGGIAAMGFVAYMNVATGMAATAMSSTLMPVAAVGAVAIAGYHLIQWRAHSSVNKKLDRTTQQLEGERHELADNNQYSPNYLQTLDELDKTHANLKSRQGGSKLLQNSASLGILATGAAAVYGGSWLSGVAGINNAPLFAGIVTCGFAIYQGIEGLTRGKKRSEYSNAVLDHFKENLDTERRQLQAQPAATPPTAPGSRSSAR